MLLLQLLLRLELWFLPPDHCRRLIQPCVHRRCWSLAPRARPCYSARSRYTHPVCKRLLLSNGVVQAAEQALPGVSSIRCHRRRAGNRRPRYCRPNRPWPWPWLAYLAPLLLGRLMGLMRLMGLVVLVVLVKLLGLVRLVGWMRLMRLGELVRLVRLPL